MEHRRRLSLLIGLPLRGLMRRAVLSGVAVFTTLVPAIMNGQSNEDSSGGFSRAIEDRSEEPSFGSFFIPFV